MTENATTETTVTEAKSTGFTAVTADRICRITITNPKRLNAIDYDAMVGLGDAFLAAGADPAVRAVVLTGEGKAFCTGADLSGVAAAAARGITPEMTMDAANRLTKSIVDCPVPVIAQINGPAAGIGVALALAADLSYAAVDSYLLLAFINIGLMPDGGAAALVAAAAGRPLANELALLGGRLPAADAVAANLINAALPDDELAARVAAAAAKLANGPRRAQELTKRALNRATLTALDQALADEHAGQVELLASADFAEGAMAMLQKRPAKFAD